MIEHVKDYNLEPPEEKEVKCIYCGETDSVILYKGFYVCQWCVEDIEYERSIDKWN